MFRVLLSHLERHLSQINEVLGQSPKKAGAFFRYTYQSRLLVVGWFGNQFSKHSQTKGEYCGFSGWEQNRKPAYRKGGLYIAIVVVCYSLTCKFSLFMILPPIITFSMASYASISLKGFLVIIMMFAFFPIANEPIEASK
ncbi:hypothetical protein SAMN04488116_1770 [Flagellimonas flava]|uniref:Uncharacterized protein n=1 Tax=Flagellimonas flava TaxID=570519 RepID=A0A1M5KTI9_9FLAO|nr:hypothetical protein SAMN04488116_1770 [Allomuricauda flava]